MHPQPHIQVGAHIASSPQMVIPDVQSHVQIEQSLIIKTEQYIIRCNQTKIPKFKLAPLKRCFFDENLSTMDIFEKIYTYTRIIFIFKYCACVKRVIKYKHQVFRLLRFNDPQNWMRTSGERRQLL